MLSPSWAFSDSARALAAREYGRAWSHFLWLFSGLNGDCQGHSGAEHFHGGTCAVSLEHTQDSACRLGDGIPARK